MRNTKSENATTTNQRWYDRPWNPIGNLPSNLCCALFGSHARIAQLRLYREPQRLLFAQSDLFCNSIPDEVIRDLYLVMAAHRRHTFLVVTKNGYRMEQWFGTWACSEAMEALAKRDRDFPAENIHLGVAIGGQRPVDDQIGSLIASPAAHRFVVVNDLYENVDLTCVQCPMGNYERTVTSCEMCHGSPRVCDDGRFNALLDSIDEVVVMEHKIRHDREAMLHLHRLQSIQEQCRLNRVPFFYT